MPSPVQLSTLETLKVIINQVNNFTGSIYHLINLYFYDGKGKDHKDDCVDDEIVKQDRQIAIKQYSTLNTKIYVFVCF